MKEDREKAKHEALSYWKDVEGLEDKIINMLDHWILDTFKSINERLLNDGRKAKTLG